MTRNNKLYIIIGVAILVIGCVVFFIWYQREQNKIAHENALKYLEATKIETEQKKKQQKALQDCLSKAHSDYKRVFELNSVEGTTPGGDKARHWNNGEIAKRSEENYRKDKEFCPKLYKLSN